MTNTQNTKAELLRRAHWLDARSETMLDISESFAQEGDLLSAVDYSDMSQAFFLQARALKTEAAAL